MMCIDLSLLDEKNIPADFICPIGKGLILEASCLSCNNGSQKFLHTFCKSCIEKHLSQFNNCPICKTHQTSAALAKLTIFDSQLNTYTSKCENFDSGCQWHGTVAEYTSHLKTCEYRSSLCKYVGCNKAVPIKDMDNHMSDCEFKSQLCQICGENYIEKNKGMHSMEEHCKFCNDSFYNCIMHSHLFICPNLDTCPQCCEQIPKQDLQTHQTSECKNRILQCSNCNKQYFSHQALHTNKQKCEFCEKELYQCELDIHIKTCPMKVVNCIYDCGMKHRLCDKKKHDERFLMEHNSIMFQMLQKQQALITTLENKIDYLYEGKGLNLKKKKYKKYPKKGKSCYDCCCSDSD